jgi:protein-S-isoprenylcysteine O-methyltransferase Ste14
MHMVYRNLFLFMWTTWALYWWALSFKVKAAARRESRWSRLLHLGPLLLAALLLWLPRAPLAFLGERFLPAAAWPFWLGAVLTGAGLLFAAWARRHIGTNWSAIVTIKEGHEFIASGPYAIVRHPIYTGLLFAFAGSALALGECRGLLALAIVAWALWRKLRLEERWMQQHFGESYQAYCRRVAALLPFVW